MTRPEHFALAGAEIQLLDSNPAYAPLIAEQQAVARELEETPMARSSHQTVHVDLWTRDGLEWDAPENADNLHRRDEVLSALADAPLLDLGCGDEPSYSQFRRFVQQYGPSMYIGINNVATDAPEDRQEIAEFGTVWPLSDDEALAPGVMVRGDMLEVLSRLPAGFNVSLNGVDEYMVETKTRTGERAPYAAAIVAEIIRVTAPGNVVFGVTKEAGLLARLAESGAFDVTFVQLPPEESAMPPLPSIPFGEQDGYYLMVRRESNEA